MAVIKKDVDELDNPERAKLLSVVDEFRALGISKEISLPQLVVVGDQSSGKSSLLEGLTGISFPTHSGLCTRFATRIILRRSSDQHAKVSIIPGPSSVNDVTRKETLLAFNPSITSEELVGARFTEIMDEAAVAMGLPPSTQKDLDNLERRFSDDVLSIEVSGPDHQHLSIVDVPGLFHNPTPTQTQGDLDTIRTMIKSYMKDKRTIMLTVMDALNNLANQEIFNLAKSADATGERIVGVITKTDAVCAVDEGPIIKVAQNEDYVFRHGWFAVRNLSTKDKADGLKLADRHAKEVEHFQKSPWSQLSKERVGVPALKIYLAQILYDHIRKEFPHLVDDIRSKVEETRKQVDGLGESRTTSSEQRQFLTRIANRYQTNNTDASRGIYGPVKKTNDPRKLRMHIRLENEKFASKIHTHGHTYEFKKVGDDLEGEAESESESESTGEDGEDGESDEEVVLKPKGSKEPNGNGNETLDSDKGSECESDDDAEHHNIYDWIRVNYRMSRGTELPGTVNPAVLEGLFQQQAAQWGPIARKYLNVVNKMMLRYITHSCKDLVTDQSIRQRIEERNKRAVETTRKLSVAQLDQILKDELGGFSQTMNNYFAENLDKNRRARQLVKLKKYLAPMMEKNGNGNGGNSVQLNFDELIQETHLSNDDSAVFDIHDTLKAYYKVAVKRFIDNVVLQVVERHYMGPDGPLMYFSPAYIGGLKDEELRHLAGESKTTTMERERVSLLLRQLERALELGEAEQ